MWQATDPVCHLRFLDVLKTSDMNVFTDVLITFGRLKKRYKFYTCVKRLDKRVRLADVFQTFWTLEKWYWHSIDNEHILVLNTNMYWTTEMENSSRLQMHVFSFHLSQLCTSDRFNSDPILCRSTYVTDLRVAMDCACWNLIHYHESYIVHL